MARRFEFRKDTSNKFWEIWCEGAVLHTRYGKLGAKGQTTLKPFFSPAAASAAEAALIGQKTAKGYVEQRPSAQSVTAKETKKAKVKLTPFLARLEADPELRAKLAKTELGPEDPNDLQQWAKVEKAVRDDGFLRLWEWTPPDVSWIPLIPQVQVLELTITDKTDLRPLAQLKSLESVKLEGTTTGFIDLSFVSSLPRLEVLEVRGPRVKSLAPLATVRTLTKLGVAKGVIDDLAPLEKLPKLSSVFLPNQRLTSLSALSRFAGLTYLQVEGNRVEDVSPLAKHLQLRFVGLKGNKVRDVSALAGLVNVETLYLGGNPVSDTSALNTLKKLATKDFTIKATTKPKLAPELATRLGALASTPECRRLLNTLLGRLREVHSGKVTTLRFDADDKTVVALELTAPAKKGAGPASLAHLMTKVGATVQVDAGRPGLSGPRVGSGANVEWDDEDRDRFGGFCNAGQNWFVWDHQKKNKLGEPGIVFFSHEGALDPKNRFPMQDKLAFGAGGFVLRTLAFRVLSNDKAWSGCGWG